MANIDKLLQTMTERDIKRAILINDQPIRLFDDLGEKKGSVVKSDWIETSLFEITPPYLNAKLTQDGRFQFQHECADGDFQITVERAMDKVKLYIVRLGQPVPQSSGSAASVINTSPSTKTINDSGNGPNSIIPIEVQEWNKNRNGGAILLPWFWCIAHEAWVDLAMWSIGPVLFLVTWLVTGEISMAMNSLTFFG